MKKIVGVSVLFLMVKMSYSAEGLTLASLTNPDINIAELPENSVNQLFGQSFQFNEVGYGALTTLAQRRRTRMGPALQFSSASNAEDSSHTDLVEGELTGAGEDGGEQEKLKSVLELTLPAMVIAPLDLFGELSTDEKRVALRTVRVAAVMGSNSKSLASVSDQVTRSYQQVRTQTSTSFTTGLVGAGLLYAASRYVVPQATRTVFSSVESGFLGMIPSLLGGAGSVFVVYGAYAQIHDILNGVRLMHAMGKDLTGWMNKNKEIVKSFQAMKMEYDALKHQMASILAVTEQLQQSMPDVVALSGDNATMAGILQGVLAQMKQDGKKIATMQQHLLVLAQHGNLPVEAQELLKIQGAASDDDQKMKIVAMYNKHGKLGNLFGGKQKIAVFDDIPGEWFEKHDKELTSAGLTVRP